MPLLQKGFLAYEEMSGMRELPCKERYAKGAVAVIECVQEIPCNPCESSCPYNAIKVGEPIVNLPELNEHKCIGCGMCVAKCPGLAIFIVDKEYSASSATVSFPHEYYPLPEKEATVNATDRSGKVICKGRIVKIANPKLYDHTPIVTVEIPKEFADEVRGVERTAV